jgi:glycine reductase
VFVTALPTIGQMVGANRILRGGSITAPTGDPSLGHDDELALRTRMVARALQMLMTDVAPLTVWSMDAGEASS